MSGLHRAAHPMAVWPSAETWTTLIHIWIPRAFIEISCRMSPKFTSSAQKSYKRAASLWSVGYKNVAVGSDQSGVCTGTRHWPFVTPSLINLLEKSLSSTCKVLGSGHPGCSRHYDTAMLKLIGSWERQKTSPQTRFMKLPSVNDAGTGRRCRERPRTTGQSYLP